MSGNIEIAVTTSEVGRRGRPRDLAKEMSKGIAIDIEGSPYIAKRNAFVAALVRSRAKALADAGIEGKMVKAEIIEGRKFDKVMLATSTEERGRFRFKVEFFIERANGAIYGSRSDFAPNFTRWFGTVDTANLWDWSNEIPVPTTEGEGTFIKVREYDGWGHYRLVSDAEADAEVEAEVEAGV